MTGISKSIDMERLTSIKKSNPFVIGTWQYVKDVFYVNLSQNRRKVKVKGVYVDVINIYGCWPLLDWFWGGADWFWILVSRGRGHYWIGYTLSETQLV